MKPLTYWIPFKITQELESDLTKLSPQEKIDRGCNFLKLAKHGVGSGLGANGRIFTSAKQVWELSPENLAKLGAALINVGVDEFDWSKNK